MSTRKASTVWHYFDKLPKEDKAKCNLCSTILVCKNTTSSLRNHLAYKHPSVSLLRPTPTATTMSATTSTGTSVNTIDNSSDKNENLIHDTTIAQGQSKLSFSRKITVGSDNWKSLVKTLVEFCAQDMRPISIVSGDGFRRFCEKLNPAFKVPCPQTIKNHLQYYYDNSKSELIKTLDFDQTKNYKYSFTTDAWTSLANEGYTTITIHYIDSEWNDHHRVLNTHEVTERHTGLNLATDFLEVLTNFGIKKESVISITADNAANMDVCIREIGVKRIRCFGHSLQLAVKAGFKLGFMDKMLGSARRIVTFFNRSTVANNCFKEKQKQL
ncbi:hypothetical protein SNE40_014212 [Patella caerulea]|uniref:BED-type domain-containing protein n=1 Tax=Patella caerulea TaxID=87958 RepID=A0AAN8PIR7_PATCE